VDRARRSSRVTTNTSLFVRAAISLASCLRSDQAPLIFLKYLGALRSFEFG
jgi:hypothetical protein